MKEFLKKLNLLPGKTDLKAWLISFGIINFAFLYHTLNFMWGNHDVKFIKEELLLSSGLFEGRFTQFIPYRILTSGQILPILNNLLGFAFLTTGLWILAKYWNIKKSLIGYVLFISFVATQPYTLSWMYFTFITISCLLWTLLATVGLYLSEHINESSYKVRLSLIAILCFYLTLGGYPPIINMFFVCLGGKIIISYVFEQKSLKQLFQIHKFTVLNIIIAAILFKISLLILNPNNVYNLETESLNNLPHKFIQTISISFKQFFITVPFMEMGYKLCLAIMSFIAIIGTLFIPSKATQKMLIIFFWVGTIWATALTTFLVVPHTEYVSRIDFYGFGFLYALTAGILLTLTPKIYQSFGVIIITFLLCLNILNDYQALKIWKQGHDAEFQILDNVVERIENHPQFNANHQYRFYQVGDISLRPNYYNGSFEFNDVFLLTIPYLAMWQGGNLLEFYTPTAYINHKLPLLPEDITPEVYDFFMHKAQPWPHPNSVYVNQDIIIIVYNQIGLDDFKNILRTLRP